MSLRPRLRRRRRRRRTRPLGVDRRRPTTSPSSATATSSSPSQDECSHAAIALSEGDVEGLQIECWLHGSRFDLRTGKPTGLPATEPVAIYPVQVDGDDVLVDVLALDVDDHPERK